MIALVATGTELQGQGRQQIAIPQTGVGSRVRVAAPSVRPERYVGRISALPSDSVTLDTMGVRRRLGLDMGPVLVDQYRYVTLPLSAVESIELSVGKTHTRTTFLGAVIGAGAVGLITGAGNLPEVNPGFKDFAEGFVTGAAIGAVVGGAVGWLLGGERWVRAARPSGALPPG
jgi:hypothetical protein